MAAAVDLCPCDACMDARASAALQPLVDEMAAEVRGVFEGTRPIMYRPMARVVAPEVRFPPLVPEGNRVAMRDEIIERILGVIYPPFEDAPHLRFPIFEWGQGTTPTEEEMRELAGKIADAVEQTFVRSPAEHRA